MNTQTKEAPSTAAEILINNGLNWEVNARPVYDNAGNEIEGHKALTRADNGEVFNIVSSRYQPFQNADALRVVDQFTGTGAAKFTGARIFRGGRRVCFRVSVPDADFDVLPGDNCKTFLQFDTTHDGTGSIRIVPLVYRMVCQNGLHRWTEDNTRVISVRHTRRANCLRICPMLSRIQTTTANIFRIFWH